MFARPRWGGAVSATTMMTTRSSYEAEFVGDSLETSQTSSQDALLAYFPLCSRHHAFLERRHYHDRADQQQQRITPGTHKYKLVLAIPTILCSHGRLQVGGDAKCNVVGVGGVDTATSCVALLLPRWLSAQIAPENWCARPNQKSWVDAGRSVGVRRASRFSLPPCEPQAP